MIDGDRPRALSVHPRSDLAGSGAIALAAATAMMRTGLRAEVVAPGPGSLADRARASGAEVVLTNGPSIRPAKTALLAFLPSIATALTILRRERPVVLFVTTVFLPQWVIAGRIAGVPVICHTCGSERAGSLLTRLTAILATRLLVPDDPSRRAVIASGAPHARTAVIRGPVIESRDARPPRPDIGSFVRLVCPEAISPWSGTKIAIEALSLLLASGAHARMVLVRDEATSDRQLRSVRRMIRQHGVEASVQIVDDTVDRWSLLDASDIVLVPRSGRNAFSAAVGEAVAAARPVVSSAPPDLDDLDGFASVIGAAADPRELADAVQRVVSNWSAFRRAAILVAPVVLQRRSPEDVSRALIVELARVVPGPLSLVRPPV